MYTPSYPCNVQPSQATANPVGGKACSSTKGGLLRTNVFYQGRLSHHITSPSEKTRPKSWPGNNMGKATPVWQLSLSHSCHKCYEQPRQATANPISRKACSSTKGGLLRYIHNTYLIHKVSSLKLHITSTQYAANMLHQRIFPREAIPSHYFPLREDSSRVLAWGLHG